MSLNRKIEMDKIIDKYTIA